MSARPSLRLVRRLKAPPARVYDAWTRPEQMAAWFGPENVRVVSAEADPRVGGRFRVVMLEDTGETHNVGGTYQEVVPERKLVFSWAWISTPERQSLVTVSLRPIAEGTELTLLHEQLFDEAAREGHRHGWTGSLDKLERWIPLSPG